MTYIRSRRFASALQRLASTNERVIEIALGSGFDTQESFTRAFKKAFGITPASYRKNHSRLPFVRKARFDLTYLSHINQNLSLEPEIRVEPALGLVGMRTRFFSVDSEKNDFARKLPALWAQFMPRMGEVRHRTAGVAYGVIRQTPEMSDELEYHAAVPVAERGQLPQGMESLTLPSARYARFTHQGRVALLDKTVNYIYSTWLARSGMRHTYGADQEIYGPDYKADSEDSVIHYAIPVESV
jgi:AraC family transcriptional regulator